MKESEIEIKSCKDCFYFKEDFPYSGCDFYITSIDMSELMDKPEFCKVKKIIVVEEIPLQRDDNTPCQYCDKIIKEFADDSDNTCKQCILDIIKGMDENI